MVLLFFILFFLAVIFLRGVLMVLFYSRRILEDIVVYDSLLIQLGRNYILEAKKKPLLKLV